ncbi:MAG TPA: zinc ribbon domain-containing protein [Candidatus Sulfotelmatobacter sp.]|nr:zinc ribbon domain-containing protein [Candidatus Sulfotelmatobacter sp.]
MATNILANFPKVNLVSILAGTLVLISVFLPWWGVDGTAFGFSGSIVSWSLWSQPFAGDTSSMTLAQANAVHTMGLLSVLVLGLVFITAAIGFLGSFAINKSYLAAAFSGAVLAIIVYAVAVSATISSLCQGSTGCISGPVGSAFANGASVSWGFQTGFYLCLVGAVLVLFAIIFHQAFLRGTTIGSVEARSLALGSARFCSGCGHPLQADAKFCSHCARPAPTS